jgi:carbohydrate 4-sulfotransferase 8
MDDIKLRKMVKAFYTIDKFRVIFCIHAKVGSSTWFNILANNSAPEKYAHKGNSDLHLVFRRYNITSLADNIYTREDILYRLKNYYKVMPVRHPFDRLVSAYRDKLVDGSPSYRRQWGPSIMKRYRGTLTEEQRQTGKGVTFEEFIRYVLDNA